MRKLLDRLDDISAEMGNIQQGFVDSEKIALDSLRETAQNILKKTHHTERSIVSANIKNRRAIMSASIAMIIDPNGIGSKNLSQIASQGESRRDSRLKNMDFAYQNTVEKIKSMSVQEIFEFLGTFSKKNLQGIITPRVIVAKPIPKRIEVKLVPVES